MVLLDFIRYHQHLAGTKIGCREGDCAACTVLVGDIREGELYYQSMTSCLMPVGNAHGKHIVTIEGINFPGQLNPVQQAMVDEGATQCGFCTPGFVLSLTGYCLGGSQPSAEGAIAAVDGNICRCTGYKSIQRAAGRVAAILDERLGEEPVSFVCRKKILPAYFSHIKGRLQELRMSERARHLPDIASLEDRRHIVAGGTDLYVQKHDEMTHAAIRFVMDHPESDRVTREGEKCFIGSSVTVTDLKDSPVIREAFPQFDHFAKLVSSTPIRNMATIAGNFVNASPIGDFTILFLALDAHLVLKNDSRVRANGEGIRVLPLRKFYKGYKQLDKTDTEHIEQTWFQLPGKNRLFNFEKVSKRRHLDIASVNSAISIEMQGHIIGHAGLSAGGVGPVPLYLEKTSQFLEGKELSAETVTAAIAIMKSEISPISDARGSKEYKQLLLAQLIKAHFITLFPQLEPAWTEMMTRE